MSSLNRALSELQSEQKSLERQLVQVKKAVGVLRSLGGKGRRGPRKMSAKSRALIGAAQRARWKKWRAAKK
ncbi:MAG: hypothetical protein WAQ52_08700 [Terriglobales bacterium]